MAKKSNLDDFKNYLVGFGAELKKHGIKLAEKDETEQLMLIFAYYKYFNANSEDIQELMDGDSYETGILSGIGGIYIDNDSENEDINILYPICCQGQQCFYRDADKIAANIENCLYNEALRPRKVSKFLDDRDISIKSKKVKIIILTNYNINNKIKNEIRYKLSRLPVNHEIEHEVVVGREILDVIINIESPKQFVEEGELMIDKKQNCLMFGKEQSLIINISAKSLQELYLKCFTKGLFAQNLRCYIKQPKIDSEIINSIQNSNDLFWYLNNGIIIICDDYELSNNKIKFKRFSIVNGGQTTYLIGNTDFEKDFYLQCKIVKNTKVNDAEKFDFIAKVAEATNSQKPIKNTDIIANKIEQRMLKKQLEEIGIFCRIKRGDIANKLIYKESWQMTNNEELAQFLASFMYLLPGVARSNKAKLFKPKGYNLIFGNDKKYNALMIKDLLKIRCAYKAYKNKIEKAEFPDDPYKKKLVNYGTFVTVALIGVIAKLYFNNYYRFKILERKTLEEQHNFIAQFDISHPIFRPDMETKELYGLFEWIYSEFYRKGYVDYKGKDPNNDYSNFSKPDPNFVRWIFKFVILSIQTNDINKVLNDFSEVAYKTSQDNINNNTLLLDKYKNTNMINFKNKLSPKKSKDNSNELEILE